MEESIKYMEKEFLIIINKKALERREESMDDTESNPNVQVIINEVEKERLEKKILVEEV